MPTLLFLFALGYTVRGWTRRIARKSGMEESNAPERLFAPVFRAMLLRVSILVAPLCALAIWAFFTDEKRKPGDATAVFGGIGILYVLFVSEITIVTRRLIQAQRQTLDAGARAAEVENLSLSSRPISVEPQLPSQHFSARRFPWFAVGFAVILALVCGGLLILVLNRSTSEPHHASTPAAAGSQSNGHQQEPTGIGVEKAELRKSLLIPSLESQPQSQKKKAQAKPDPMPSWVLPIRIGENRESVYRTLGEPSLDYGQKFAKNNRTPQFKAQKQEGKKMAWQKRGLIVEFVDDRVAEITVILKPWTTGEGQIHYDAYVGGLFLGIKNGDDFKTVTAKFGPGDFSGEPLFAEWEIAPFFIHVTYYEFLSVSISDLQNHLKEKAAREQATKIDWSAYKQEQKLVELNGEILTPKEIYRRYAPRVVGIDALDSHGQASSRGTGFAWKRKEIITNRHVIAQARALEVKWPARALEFSNRLSHKEQDWAVLEPSDDENSTSLMAGLPPVAIAKTLPEVGDAVIVIGNPKGLTNSLSTGIVAGLRKTDAGIWIQITAPISAGSSGSPVFNEKGYLIGLATMRLMDGENLNFVTPVHQIVEGQKQNPNQKDELQVWWEEQLPLDHYGREPMGERWKACKTSADVLKHLQKLLAEFADPEDQEHIFDDAVIRSSILNVFDLELQILRRKVAQFGTTYTDWAEIGDCLLELKRGQEARDAFISAIALAARQSSFRRSPLRPQKAGLLPASIP